MTDRLSVPLLLSVLHVRYSRSRLSWRTDVDSQNGHGLLRRDAVTAALSILLVARNGCRAGACARYALAYAPGDLGITEAYAIDVSLHEQLDNQVSNSTSSWELFGPVTVG